MVTLLLASALMSDAPLSAIEAEPRVRAAAALEAGDAEKAADLLGEDSELAARVREGDESALADLRFRPVIEGEQPPGFPPLTPVGEIERKSYPGYRLAKTDGEGGAVGGNTVAPFFRLFRHIQAREIPMTIPVEMEMADEKMRSMAFLYPDSETGETGDAEEEVEVTDVPAMRVVSIGVRGDTTDAAVSEALGRLTEWLAAHPDAKAEPGYRVLGYNGPMTAPAKRYFEVQRVLKSAG